MRPDNRFPPRKKGRGRGRGRERKESEHSASPNSDKKKDDTREYVRERRGSEEGEDGE